MLYGIVNPLPVCQNTLCLFASHLAQGGLSYGTIKTYLSAVRHLQVTNDFEDPRLATMPKLQLVQKGIRRLGGSSGSARVRLPVTPSILKTVKAVWAKRATDYEMILLWAVCCTAFFGFFRLGELLEHSSQLRKEVSIQDVTVDNPEGPSMISIRLRKLKTDQFGRGVTICLGQTGQDICPVGSLLAYLAVRGSTTGPLFRWTSGKALTKSEFVEKFRAVLKSAGVDESSYAGHSFRIGAATTAAEKGFEDSTIKMLGRWQSDAFQAYIRTPNTTLAAMSARLMDEGPSGSS